mmetsp:Transcript_195/g.419  ORF Transcript_195/g.419 Transcript_195/m.419 type:complete len:110 (+) Transcript_195:459-788(+)
MTVDPQIFTMQKFTSALIYQLSTKRESQQWDSTYLCLPVAEFTKNNTTWTPRTFMAFKGASDFMKLDQNAFKLLIFKHQDGINDFFDLSPSNFTANPASIEIEKKRKKF